MIGWLLRHAGRRVVHKAVHKASTANGTRPPLVDFGLGFDLMRDRRVPVGAKGLAVLLGAALIGLFITLELPVEAIVGALLNIVGFGFDFLVDGLEVLAGPLLFGALMLPRLAPAHIVARIRAERSGIPIETAASEPVPPQPPVYGELARF